jgi:hypothetical protein
MKFIIITFYQRRADLVEAELAEGISYYSLQRNPLFGDYALYGPPRAFTSRLISSNPDSWIIQINRVTKCQP